MNVANVHAYGIPCPSEHQSIKVHLRYQPSIGRSWHLITVVVTAEVLVCNIQDPLAAYYLLLTSLKMPCLGFDDEVCVEGKPADEGTQSARNTSARSKGGLELSRWTPGLQTTGLRPYQSHRELRASWMPVNVATARTRTLGPSMTARARRNADLSFSSEPVCRRVLPILNTLQVPVDAVAHSETDSRCSGLGRASSMR